jgi:uncharacterized repeat protein (TIGR03837 family)
MLWDVYCHVVDNFGDIGVCWRLACDLAARGVSVRLWVDDTAPLGWMAPGGAHGVEVIAWDEATPLREPGDVVIEAFGCNPPPAFVARMRRPHPPVWINLEYLSAESHAERNHGLPSPQSAGVGQGLTKWFYYPGFSAASGGLIREAGLEAARAGFDRLHWLDEQGIALAPGERAVSLFCYENAALPDLLQALSTEPTLLLVTPDAAARQVQAALGPALARGALRAHLLPYSSQVQFDRLLWACDLNFVRGEDSFVRALWAARPFVWQLYPQDDGAHAAKMQAFLARYLDACEPAFAAAQRALWSAWNGLGPWPAQWPAAQGWRAHAAAWSARLAAQSDLGTRLLGFAREKREKG